MGKLFGTDGVRGVAVSELSPELAMKIGRATASVLSKTSKEKPLYVIGCDTRISGDMLQSALACGICSVGCDVMMLGVLPTPAVALLTQKYHASAGFVISASHNPAEFNGIKVFNHDGYKLPDEVEFEIESYILDPEKQASIEMAAGDETGRITYCENGAIDYVDYITGCIDGKIEGINVLLDCANGAASHTAPLLFERLGVKFDIIGDQPNGVNINKDCGSTHLDSLREKVLKGGYDIGVAFDGDADRCLCIDEKGNELDGDRIIAALATDMKERGELTKDTVVVTVMSNLGFMQYMKSIGITCSTTAVGDRYVLENMREEGFDIGGEQSGHLILLKHSTTGDGQLTAAKLLQLLAGTHRTASEITQVYDKFPQVIKNLRVSATGKERYRTDEYIEGFIEAQQQALMGEGRVLVRLSGTEPLIRVMVEGKEPERIEIVANLITKKITERLAKYEQ